MSFTTRNRLAAYVSERQNLASAFNEAMLLAKVRECKSVPKVFLSHSHTDTALIKFAEILLIDEGAGIYIDHKDPALPQTPDVRTADLLRGKIVECTRFVMLASDRAVGTSRWVPWELGYADGKKEQNQIAVLPVLESGEVWTGSEYVGLYPTIQEWTPGQWRVCPPGTSYSLVTLKEWLHS